MQQPWLPRHRSRRQPLSCASRRRPRPPRLHASVAQAASRSPRARRLDLPLLRPASQPRRPPHRPRQRRTGYCNQPRRRLQTMQPRQGCRRTTLAPAPRTPSRRGPPAGFSRCLRFPEGGVVVPATPKPPGQRVRVNAEQPQWRRLPADGRAGRAPALAGSSSLPKAARDWWRDVWRSPMAAVFVEADVPALARACRLVAREVVGEASTGELAELRQLEDRFGLSPLARRRLQWEIEQSTGAGVAPRAWR